MEEIYNKLIEKVKRDNIYMNEEMAKHTSFKIGGPADIFVKVESVEKLKYVLQVSKENEVPVTVIGNGSNILVKDRGIRGIVVKLQFAGIEINNEEIEVGAGVLLSKVARLAYENSLAGFEFASGIPGTIGGAVTMNAGAYGREFKDIVATTTYMNENLEIKTVNNKEHNFEYRNSIFKNSDFIILNTKLKLTKGNQEEIKKKMDENNLKRRNTQPIEYPNAGSIFKRGNNFITAELIDKCGLKGYNINDAYVSEKHSGFIVNKGKAKAEDVINLIEHIKKTVYEKFGVTIELEIRVIGE